MAIFALWSFVKLIMILNPVLSVVIPGSQFIFAISAFTPAIILYIVITHLNYPRWFKKSHAIFLFLIPLFQAFLALTNGIHHLFVKDYIIAYYGNLPEFSYEPGVMNFIFPVYLFGTLLCSLLILLRNFFTGSNYINKQVFLIFVAIMIPAINDILGWFDISLIPDYRLTPEFFIFGNLFFAWALIGYKFLNLKPLTRNLIIENIEDIIMVIDPEHRITDINKSGEIFFHLSLKDIIGKPISDHFNQFSELINFVYGESEIKEICLLHNHKNHYFIAKQSFVTYSAEQNLATVLILGNITERKEAEIQLQKYSHDLEVSNALKDKSFSIIANDIKNPFQGIIGYSNFIISEFEKLDPIEMKSIVYLMNQNSKKGYDLLVNLVEWSRFQTESLDFNPELTSLTDILQEALLEQSHDIHLKNIAVDNQISGEQIVFADRNMIYSVLRNLFSNAVKFNEINGRIAVSSEINSPNQKIRVTISDTGIGIPQELIGRLFNITNIPIQNHADKRHGLGLLLCKEYIDKNGGEITIESREGEGTKVCFSIPYLENIIKQEKFQLDLSSGDNDMDRKLTKYILPETQWVELLDKLIHLLEMGKIYKNRSLTINDIASLLNTNRTYLSQIINDSLNTNFSNLINEYRLKEADQQLKLSGKKLTMEAIALDCGFRSKSAFYVAYKKQRGCSPTGYSQL
jgi:PAS domain S-box-containing protein